MKTNIINSLLIATLMAFATVVTVTAQPPGKGDVHHKLATEDDFAALKSGDRIALVCKQCETVVTSEVENQAEAMETCKMGRTIHCPECKMDYKVSRKGHPAGKVGGSDLKEEVIIVNANGEPCMFYTKIQ